MGDKARRGYGDLRLMFALLIADSKKNILSSRS